MMTQIQVFKSKGHGKVRGFADSKGTVFINVTDIAYGLGFINKSGKIRLNKINNLLNHFNYGYEVTADDYIPENMFYRLAMKADNEAANSFQAYLADEVIPSIRRTGGYSVNSAPALPASDIRRSNIATNKSFRSVIQLFIYYAQSQGDTRDEGRVYAKFISLANKAADIVLSLIHI